MTFDRTTALKEVRPDRDSADARARLVREARLNGRSSTPESCRSTGWAATPTAARSTSCG